MSVEELERLAGLIVELLEERSPAARLLTAEELAGRLRVKRSWVYEHASELGALRLGDGKKSRLRFRWETVVERLSCSRSMGSSGPDLASARVSTAMRRRRSGTRPLVVPAEPLEVRGERVIA